MGRAIEAYSKAIELDPSYAEAYYARGSAYYYNNGQYDRAIEDSSKAISLKPDFGVAYSNRVVFL